MYFSRDVTSWIDLIDDGNAMLSRLKTLEYLLFNCAMDLPLRGVSLQAPQKTATTEVRCCSSSMRRWST